MHTSEHIIHPGTYIRNSIIPKDMTTTAASKLLGVGRPALSNLLNGNASLSLEMAVRLEKAFGVDHKDLLLRQTAFDQLDIKKTAAQLEVRNYVPDFCLIKSAQIESWVGNELQARSLLAVLLRKLIHSTATGLVAIDFPGYDNAERKGWDGTTTTTAATPWVPEGASCWEFGCNSKPVAKAEKDYSARSKSVPLPERLQTNFVFVTPKHWPGKTTWQKEKSAEGKWRAVKVYDASDLEQWLEQSLPVQAWLAHKIGSPEEGAESLETHWDKWALVTEPQLTTAVFDSFVDQYREVLLKWLSHKPTEPLIIAADSKEEALAFVYAAFKDAAFLKEKYLDNTIVFSSDKAFNKIAKATASFITVIFSDAVERESGNSYKNRHTIIIRHKNDTQSTVDISIGELGYEMFEKALTDMGVNAAKIPSLALESGRSLTVLRRRLSPIPAVRTPLCAGDPATARDLIPFMFAGTWNTQYPADIEILGILSGWTPEMLEEKTAGLLHLQDGALWSVQKVRGVVSKIDILFAVAPHITETILKKFLDGAKLVLSEKDPSLDLPEDKRWAASLYGKTRNHSAILRRSIAETLVMLAVHGNALLKSRLGFDVEAGISQLVSGLLTPFNYETIASQNNQLPYYAEAVPEVFLKIVRADLDRDDPQLFSVLTPVDAIFSTSSRTGLLWALECLAWDPQRLQEVCEILAKMTVKKINDSLVHKPHASLEAIFRSWMPQTAATLEQRKKALDFLVRRYPAVAWQVCIRQLAFRDIGHYSRKPVWRKEYFDFGHTTTQQEHREFLEHVAALTISWTKHTEQTLGDLIQRFQVLGPDVHDKLLQIIEDWGNTATDESKLALRETIRKSIMMKKKTKELPEKIRLHVKKVYAGLASSDVVMKHSWLFITPWVDLAPDEIDDAVLDHEERQQKITRLRNNALTEIYSARGTSGIIQLLSSGDAAGHIGWPLAQGIIPAKDLQDFLSAVLQPAGEAMARKIDDLLRGFLAGISFPQMKALFDTTAETEIDSDMLRLLKMAPPGAQIWNYMNETFPHLTTQYWKQVRSQPGNYEMHEVNEMIDQFLAAGRPDAAFFAIRLMLEKIDTLRLIRVLAELAANVGPDEYKFPSYNFTTAFTILNSRPDTKEEELAGLEFKYVNALDEEYGMPNLQRQISKFPALYMQLLATVYQRADKKDDEQELEFINHHRSSVLGTSSYKVLMQLNRIPGTGDDEAINAGALGRWIDEVSNLCARHDRTAIGDQCIGQLLARAPIGEDGIWPCEPVRIALEDRLNDDMAAGLRIGVFNGQGVIFRGVGGSEEHKSAAKYEKWAKDLSFDYPAVARALNEISKAYDRDAREEESDAALRTKLVR